MKAFSGKISFPAPFLNESCFDLGNGYCTQQKRSDFDKMKPRQDIVLFCILGLRFCLLEPDQMIPQLTPPTKNKK